MIKFGIMYGEEPIPIEQTQGNVRIPIVSHEQIHEKLHNMNSKDRSMIKYIHISTVQIIMKATFFEKINAPLKIEISDDRIIDKNEALIASGTGNLSHGKIKFDINLQLGLSLLDNNLSDTITLRYELLRKRFMKDGNHPFSITYKINYALTNSHHSITFRNKSKIEIDDLFKELMILDEPQRKFSRPTRSSSFRLLEDNKNKKDKKIIIDDVERNGSVEELHKQIRNLSKRF